MYHDNLSLDRYFVGVYAKGEEVKLLMEVDRELPLVHYSTTPRRTLHTTEPLPRL